MAPCTKTKIGVSTGIEGIRPHMKNPVVSVTANDEVGGAIIQPIVIDVMNCGALRESLAKGSFRYRDLRSRLSAKAHAVPVKRRQLIIQLPRRARHNSGLYPSAQHLGVGK